jgi:hypothetical protein
MSCSCFLLWTDNILQDNKVELLTNISFYAHMYSHFFVATQTQNVMNIKEEVKEEPSRRFIAKTYISNKFTIILLNWERIEMFRIKKKRQPLKDFIAHIHRSLLAPVPSLSRGLKTLKK